MNKAGLTNIKLSEILSEKYSFNISKESIQKYRKGTRTPEPQFIYFVSKILNVSGNYLLGMEEKVIPLIGKASCGIPKEYDLNGYEPIPVPSKIYKNGMYAVEADGDSMKTKINHGDILYCDPNARIDIGNIVHYFYEGESGIKRYKENEKGDTILLVPENNDYDIIIIKKDNEKDLVMVRVVKRIESL
jgi:SOS-response transcriptional repressor LexA